MLVERPQIRSRIRRMVEKLVCPASLRQDLEQEALIHLWQTETQLPGKTLSWYCEACRFHVRHEADRGRSVDSPKRRHLRCPIDLSSSADEVEGDEFVSADGTPLERCCVLDTLEQLRSRLGRPARRILHLLLADYGVREIARVVGLSPAAVVKHRERIASTASELGLER